MLAVIRRVACFGTTLLRLDLRQDAAVGESDGIVADAPAEDAVDAVSEADEITYCEEALTPAGGSPMVLGTAVIPLEHSDEDGAKALLLFRRKEAGDDQEEFQSQLLGDASDLLGRVAAHHN